MSVRQDAGRCLASGMNARESRRFAKKLLAKKESNPLECKTPAEM
jgi:hypothetical protein